MRKWDDQWDVQSIGYVEALGPLSKFKHVLLKNKNSRHLIIGASLDINLVSQFSDDIIGINISAKELQRAKPTQANLILGDAHNFPITDCSIDFIVCKATLHHLNPEVALSEMNRVLREGSQIILYEPGLLNPIAYFGRKFFRTDIHDPSEKPFNPVFLRKLLHRHFQIVSENDYLLFTHVVPILGKRLTFFRNRHFISAIYKVDETLCKSFLRNFCWILFFVLKKPKLKIK
jgi:SAM-dependent methyltransferase